MYVPTYSPAPVSSPLGGGLGGFGGGFQHQHRPRLPSVAFAPEGVGGGDGGEGADPQTFSAVYVRELRAENKGLRLRLRGFEDENPKLKAAADDAETRIKEAVKVAQKEATASFNQRLIASELRSAATAAGMVDLDGLKLLDTSKVTVGDEGTVYIPDGFFDGAKESKPYLFKAPVATGAETGTTASTGKPPAPSPTGNKNARDMTEAEFNAELARLTR